MSNLIDRYLAAIARELPAAQRADITAELRDELMSRLEAQEERLGRPLTTTELEGALKDFGNPLLVAGRYRRTQHLIGPQIFPFWWRTMRVALTVIAAVYVVLFALAMIVDGGRIAPHAPSPVFIVGFAFGIITLIFAIVERYGSPEKLARRWRPARLPPAKGRTKGPFEIMVEMGLGAVALAWWVGAIHFRNTWPGVRFSVELAPVWATFFWTITAYFLAELAVNAHALLRPARVRLNGILAIARNLTGATILLGVRQAGHFVEVNSAYLSPDVLATAQANFDRGFSFAIGVAIAIFVGLALVEVWRLSQFLRLQTGPTLA